MKIINTSTSIKDLFIKLSELKSFEFSIETYLGLVLYAISRFGGVKITVCVESDVLLFARTECCYWV